MQAEMRSTNVPQSVASDRDLAIDAQRIGATEHRLDAVAIEEPLEIRVGRPGEPGMGHALSVTMRTPGHDGDLAMGFLYGEGIVRKRATCSRRALRTQRQCPAGRRARRPAAGPDSLSRNFYTTSSCGVCGKASIEAVTASRDCGRSAAAVVRSEALRSLARAARGPVQFAETGGMHAVGLFDADGALLASYEDVGRHNAMDKLVGAALTGRRVAVEERIVLLSGRASFELLQKAMMAGAPVVAAIGAPSTLAVELAQSAGITLIAFLRDQGCNVYSHGARAARRRSVT